MKNISFIKKILGMYFIFFVVIVIIIPLISGYNLSLDMSWGPNYPLPDAFSNIFLLIGTIKLLAVIIPMWLVQKLILATIIVLAGMGAHRLVETIKTKAVSQYLPHVAGILYIFNPFFYTRLIAGQWLVLAGYALLPWAVLALWRFFEKPSKKTALRAGLWAGAIGLVSLHVVGIFALVALVMAIVVGRGSWRQWWRPSLLVAAIWLAMNCLWFFPTLAGHSPASDVIDSVGSSQLEAFATKGTIAGSVPLSTLLLHGFWADDQGRYDLPVDIGLWWIGATIVIALVVIGIVRIVRRRDKLGIVLLVSGVIGWYLAMGVAWIGSEAVSRLLSTYLPFYGGYREPHKWLMLLVLLYAYAAVQGTIWLCERLRGSRRAVWRDAVIGTALLAPILFAPSLLFGLGGQLRSADYPRGWYDMQTELDRRHVTSQVVVLPWHMYLRIDFAGRTVANPARYFFRQTVVTGNNVELQGVADTNRTDLDNTINNFIIPTQSVITDAGTRLARHGVQYVMLMKQSDWQEYDWLDKQKDMKQVYENDSWRLYEIIEVADE